MTPPLASTPRCDGFHMPAEWADHAGTFMIWPERADNWGYDPTPGQRCFAEIAGTIARFEPLTMLVSPGAMAGARALLDRAVRILEAASDDAWCRDTGPTFVVNAAGEVRGVDWIFNAWGGLLGGLYAPWDRDDAVAAAICAEAGASRYRAPLVLEGGSIHVDGEGTVLTTEECLLNPNRNPSLSREEIEGHLRDYLGIETVLWLGAGTYNDETDGHVDNLACFLRPGVVALGWEDDPSDPNFAICRDAEARLRVMTDARGRRIEVVRLPFPAPLVMTDAEAARLAPLTQGHQVRTGGNRLAGSYVNFYLGNGFGLVPQFGVAEDAEAMRVLRAAYPDREMIGIATREVLLGGGNIHCITQQMPAGR